MHKMLSLSRCWWVVAVFSVAWAGMAFAFAPVNHVVSTTMVDPGVNTNIMVSSITLQARKAAAVSRPDIKVSWDNRRGTPSMVQGLDLLQESPSVSTGKSLGIAAAPDFAEKATRVMDKLAGLYGIQDASSEFSPRSVRGSETGYQHVRLDQKYKGLPVFGGQVMVHFNRQGLAFMVNGQYRSLGKVDTVPVLTAEQATAVAAADQETLGNPVGKATTPVLTVYAREGAPVLAYQVTISYAANQGVPGRWRYWVNAKTGGVLLRFNDVPAVGTPVGGLEANIQGSLLLGEGGSVTNVTGWKYDNNYYLWNTTQTWRLFNSGGGIHIIDPDAYTWAFRSTTNWGESDRAEISLGSAFEGILGYYRSVHGRNSFDDNGAMAQANVHYGNNYVNAYWDGTDFTFGDGDGSNAGPLGIPDIAGHEFTHAVTEYTAGLVYDYVDSGALNESFSDIFGTLIEFATQPDGRAAYPGRVRGSADWLCGEDCWMRSTALRDLRNPANPLTVSTLQPSRYQGSNWDPYGEMHQNDGVQNFFFYLLCEGGSGVNDGISYFVPGIGIPAGGKLAYLTLTQYMTPDTDYPMARDYWMAAAQETDAAGITTSAVSSVMMAWAAVGVGDLVYVWPESNYVAAGPPTNGPYVPTNKVYTLFNPSSNNVTWTLSGSTPAWLNISASSVSLSTGECGRVTFSINQDVAKTLPAGTYLSPVSFTNETGIGNTTRSAFLRIGNNYVITSADYDWIDPVAGLHAPVLAVTGVSEPHDLPFPVTLYDITYNSIYFTPYGMVGFTPDGLNSQANSDLPDPAAPNGILCPLWSAIDARLAPATMYFKSMGTAPNRKVVVTWLKAPHASDRSATFSFQAIISEAPVENPNNDIIFQYQNVAEQNADYGSGQSATIGIEDEYGALGRKYSYNGEMWLANQTALRFTQLPTQDTNAPVGKIQAWGGVGQTATFEVKFNETVTGFDTNDVVVTSTTLTNVYVSGVAGAGMRYLVSVTNITGLGSVSMRVLGNAVADWAGNFNAPFGPAVYVVPVESTNFVDKMEKSPALWTVSTNVYDLLTQKAWEWGVPAYSGGPDAFSGTHCWGTVLTGDYPNGMNAWLLSAPIEVGANPILDFELWHEFEYIDGPIDMGYVEVDNGSGFVNVTPTPELAYNGSSGGWIHQTIVLDNQLFGNRNIRVRFRATSDYTVTMAGMYVDDVVVHSQRAPGVWVVDYSPTNGTAHTTGTVTFTVYNSSTNVYSPVSGDVSSPNSGVSIVAGTAPVSYGTLLPGTVTSGAAQVGLAAAGNFTSPEVQLIHQARSGAATLSSDVLPFTVIGVSASVATNVLAVTSSTGVTNWLGQFLKGSGGSTSCLYQVIAAGTDGVPNAPLLNGQVTGDDQILYASGTFLPWGRFGEGSGIPPDYGRFRSSFNHGVAPGGKVFIRAWDASSFDGSVAYGDSALYTIVAGSAQSVDFGSWLVGASLSSSRDFNGDGILDAYCITNLMDPRFLISALPASWSLGQDPIGSVGMGAQQFGTTLSPTRLFYKGDYLFVLDTGNNRIQIWNRLTRQYMGAYGTGGAGNGSFSRPVGLALDPSANRFAVADQGNYRIQVFSFDPAVPTNITFQFSFGSDTLSKPTDVAIDSWGWFYVADERTSSMDESVVEIFLPNGYDWGALATAGKAPGLVGKPGGVCVGPDDTIYVADTDNNRVQAFDSSWTLIWPLTGTNSVSFSKPWGVQVGLGGRVYVADTGNSQVRILRKDGSYIATLGSQGTGFNLSMNHPYGLMPVMNSNIVYVADTYNHRVLTIAPIYDGDGDGMDDIWEELHGLNPDVNDALSHSFGSDMPNIGYYRLGLNPSAFVPIQITGFTVTPPSLKWITATNGGIYQVEYSYDSAFIASNSWVKGPIYTSGVNGTASMNSGLTFTNTVQYIRVKRVSP